jgi:hypothetical protein
MLFYRCVFSPSQRESFLRSASLVQGVVLNHRVFSLPQIILVLYLPLKLVIKFETQSVIKFNFQSISFVIFLYVMYYTLLL